MKRVVITTDVNALRKYCEEWYEKLEATETNRQERLTHFIIMLTIITYQREAMAEEMQATFRKMGEESMELTNMVMELSSRLSVEEVEEAKEESERNAKKFSRTEE